MKNLYEIKNKKGGHVCYQAAKNKKQAVDFARMYGHKGAAKAAFVRADQ